MLVQEINRPDVSTFHTLINESSICDYLVFNTTATAGKIFLKITKGDL